MINQHPNLPLSLCSAGEPCCDKLAQFHENAAITHQTASWQESGFRASHSKPILGTKPLDFRGDETKRGWIKEGMDLGRDGSNRGWIEEGMNLRGDG